VVVVIRRHAPLHTVFANVALAWRSQFNTASVATTSGCGLCMEGREPCLAAATSDRLKTCLVIHTHYQRQKQQLVLEGKKDHAATKRTICLTTSLTVSVRTVACMHGLIISYDDASS
jgi:hypothetical protein